MSDPGNAAAQQGAEETQVEPFETKVETALKAVTRDENGKEVLPEGLDEPVKYAVTAELRRRHTQSEFDKNRQSLRAKEAENEALRKLAVPKLELTVEEAEELEDLKVNDPDAWRVKLNEHETKAKVKIDKDLEGVNLTATQAAEVERRKQVLATFIEVNPELTLNDEVLANDIPPRIKSKIEKGEITFEQFLEESKTFLLQNKQIGSRTSLNNDPDLNNVGGGANATDIAVSEDIKQSYEKEIY